MGGSAGLVLTGFSFLEIKVELPAGVERRGGTGGVAGRLGLPGREVVTGVATGGAAALLAVEVSLQWARLDLAALVAPRVLQSPTVGCLDLPGDGLERLSLGHQTDPQPHVVETLQCSAVQCNHQDSSTSNSAIANNWLAKFIISSRLRRAAMH